MRWWEFVFGSLGIAAVAALVMVYVMAACALIDRCYAGEKKYAVEFYVPR